MLNTPNKTSWLEGATRGVCEPLRGSGVKSTPLHRSASVFIAPIVTTTSLFPALPTQTEYFLSLSPHLSQKQETTLTAIYFDLSNPSISIQDSLGNSCIYFRHWMEQQICIKIISSTEIVVNALRDFSSYKAKGVPRVMSYSTRVVKNIGQPATPPNQPAPVYPFPVSSYDPKEETIIHTNQWQKLASTQSMKEAESFIPALLFFFKLAIWPHLLDFTMCDSPGPAN